MSESLAEFLKKMETMGSQGVQLTFGEMEPQELRTAKAIIKYMVTEIRKIEAR